MSDDAMQRRARALRENLRRRKQQARARDENLPGEALPVDAVLAFWFGPPGVPAEMQERWFKADPEFDAAISARFEAAVEAALDGRFDAQATDPRAALALVVLLDQFPRNLFRGQARAFAGDQRARALAARALDAGWDQALASLERSFLYLPFEHSEALADQERSVALFASLPAASWRAGVVRHAEQHRDVILRFGRFPHRNQALGRVSTAAELAYLATPGAGF
jgi:uncharacterized protein (DUF924 family)